MKTTSSLSMDFGTLILAHRNSGKLTQDLLAERAGLPVKTIQEIESGEISPTFDQIQQLAQAMTLNVRDMFPMARDTTDGVKILRKRDRYVRTITRGGKPYYEYADLVTSTEIPTMKPELLTLLCSDEADLQMNKGHSLHQCTYVLHGRLRFYWKSEGEIKRQEMEEGDCFYIRPFVPHSFLSCNPKDPAEILAFTFAGNLSGEAAQELAIIGKRGAARIIEDVQWFEG